MEFGEEEVVDVDDDDTSINQRDQAFQENEEMKPCTIGDEITETDEMGKAGIYESADEVIAEDNYAEYLLNFRESYGITKKRLSEIVGVSEQQIAAWEAVRKTPRLNTWFNVVHQIDHWKSEHPYNAVDQCGEILLAVMDKYALSTNELSVIIGCASSTLWRWCSGKSRPQYEIWTSALEKIYAWMEQSKR